MPDENCHHYTAVGNPKSPIPTRCLAPLRYQNGRDLSTDDFSCTSNDYQNCIWNPEKKGLIRLLDSPPTKLLTGPSSK
jgi:hypothetical protein